MEKVDLLSIWSFLDNVAFTQGYVDAAGYKTRYINAGPKDAPVVVMIHGMGGSWENFTANFAAFSKHFNTFAYDLVGHGYTAKPDKVIDVNVYVEQLKGFVDAFELKDLHLFGLSMGSWTSLKFTLKYPELVAKNIIMSSWGRPRGFITPEMKKAGEQILVDRLKSVDEPSYEAIDKVFDGLIHNPSQRMKDLVTLRLRLYQQEEMPKSMRNIFEGVSYENWDRLVFTDDELRSLTGPTMILPCVDFPDLFLKTAHEYKELIPDLVWVPVKGASHWPQWEEADFVNEESIKFFKA